MIATLRSDEGIMISETQHGVIVKFIMDNENIFVLGGAPTPSAEYRVDTGDHRPIVAP